MRGEVYICADPQYLATDEHTVGAPFMFRFDCTIIFEQGLSVQLLHFRYLKKLNDTHLVK